MSKIKAIPNMRGLITSSSLGTFTNCPQQYLWAYIERLKRIKEKWMASDLGSWGHDWQEIFYRSKNKYMADQAFEKAHLEFKKKIMESRGFFVDEYEEYEEFVELGRYLINAYYEHYGMDDFKKYDILFTEEEFRVPIIHPVTGERSPYFDYGGMIDVAWMERLTKGLWIMDHKFLKSWDEGKVKAQYDQQLLGYSYGLKHWMKIKYNVDVEVFGVMFNIILKVKMAEPKLVTSGTRFSKVIAKTDHATYLAAIKRHDFKPEDYKEKLDDLKANPVTRFVREEDYIGKQQLHDFQLRLFNMANQMYHQNYYYKAHGDACTYCQFQGNICFEDNDAFREQFVVMEKPHNELKKVQDLVV